MLMVKSLCGILFLLGIIVMGISLWQLKYKYCAGSCAEHTETFFHPSVSVMNTFLGCMLIGVASMTLML